MRIDARLVLSVLAAWVVSIGFDLFLHGGLLARLYLEPSPFLLPMEEAFHRIPFGYLAFLGLTIALAWLLRRLEIRGAVPGFRYGAAAGAIVWGAMAAGLYSISTASLPLLAGWWVGQTIELGLAGAVLGAAASRVSLKRIWAVVGLAVLAFVAATIVLQSTGLAPAMKSRGERRRPALKQADALAALRPDRNLDDDGVGLASSATSAGIRGI